MRDPSSYEREYASSASRFVYLLAGLANPLAVGAHVVITALLPGEARIVYLAALAAASMVVIYRSRSIRVSYEPETGGLRIRNLWATDVVAVAHIESIEFRHRPRWTWLIAGHFFGGTYCVIHDDESQGSVLPMVATVAAWNTESSFAEMLRFFELCGLTVTVSRAPRSR